jgi:uncharacterized protein YjbI with pentapeptide repeats
MANQKQLAILKKSVSDWNQWLKKTAARVPGFTPDLSNANLRSAKLFVPSINKAVLRAIHTGDLNRSKLPGTRINLSRVDLTGADLRGADLQGAYMNGTNLERANLQGANLWMAELFDSNLSGADLRNANLSEADLRGANAIEANLGQARLDQATLFNANFRGADFRKATLIETNLNLTLLCGADLRGADLRGAYMVKANLEKANLAGCRVYGVSAWDVKIDDSIQTDLVITTIDRIENVTVDGLEVAQFIYLLLDNAKIRHIIDTITCKVVLILGRFTPRRKDVLDELRAELRRRDYVPVLFDFDKPASRDTHETVTTLARLARFIIADITDPKSIPQELVSIVEQLPSVHVQPILRKGSRPWGMYDHIKRYASVKPLHQYRDINDLLFHLNDILASATMK